jgi:hypothetical protein
MWDLIGVLLDLLSIPGGRITVKDRYEMKRKARELKKQEKELAAAKRANDRKR